MYLSIGNSQLLPERHIIGIFDLEITSQSRITSAYLKNAERESLVVDACEDIPKSFLVCDHPYHRQIVYLSQFNSRTLQSRAEEQEKRKKNLSKYFGSIQSLEDGLDIQRRMRDEWN